MKLTDLSPRWLNAYVFAFLCPCCQKVWLTCKNVPMHFMKQHTLFEQTFGDDWNQGVVPTRDEFAWAISGIPDFSVLNVQPSLDASASGHWHGHITNGEIVGGKQKQPGTA